MAGRAIITDLKGSLSGYVAEPSDPAYATAVTIDNGRVQLRPAFVVYAGSAADIAVTLRYARDAELPLTVRGGGHSAAGYCMNDGGIVLDLALLNAVTLNEEAQTLRVQMGATWEQIYAEIISRTHLIPIGGGCLPVGIPGFVLGGGFSFVSRSYGMSIDNLISLTLVTPDGELRTISDEAQDPDERDLFWACRGGGGGNFGVAVEMVLQMHEPNTQRMLVGTPRWPAERAGEVLGFYNDWIETVPRELAAYGYWGTEPSLVPPVQTNKVMGFTIIYNGDFGEGLSVLEPLLELDPSHVSLTNLTLPEAEELIGGSTVVGDRKAYMRSGMMPPKSFTSDVIDIFSRNFDSAPSPDSFAVWTHLGGKEEEVAPDATAFPHRQARFMPELKAIWTDAQDTRVNVEWAHRFFEELRPHFTGAYVNYIDPLLADWPRMYYGDNYERLLRAKQRWDPDRLFDAQQSIGSTFEPSQAEPLDLSPLNRTFVPKEV
jgi:FAD binding domain/Berberine and berberine like